MNTTKALTKAEMEVMKVIWAKDGQFLAEIYEAMPEPRPAYTTVSTVVRTLIAKKFMRFEAFGKSNRYHAAVSREDYSRGAMARMQRDLFGGSYTAMFSFFAKQEQVSAEEMEELMAMISQQDE